MIKFVNAKINLGLNIVRKREDGYHDLETVFFPVGIESGMPQQPEAFDDILEVTMVPGKASGCRFQFMGRRVSCPPEKNLVVKSAQVFFQNFMERIGGMEESGMYHVSLDKHLPDGAGLGGGSADAAFCLTMLNEITGSVFSDTELAEMALRLGADCPFFIYNTPSFAEGVGEILTPIEVNLKGNSLLIVKPEVSVSTKEAFAGITPGKPKFDLRFLPHLPLDKWRDNVVNDFEASLFPRYPELRELKEELYEKGAVYASMTGSGSALYGIFNDEKLAREAQNSFDSTNIGVWLFGL